MVVIYVHADKKLNALSEALFPKRPVLPILAFPSPVEQNQNASRVSCEKMCHVEVVKCRIESVVPPMTTALWLEDHGV